MATRQPRKLLKDGQLNGTLNDDARCLKKAKKTSLDNDIEFRVEMDRMKAVESSPLTIAYPKFG